MSVVSSSMKYTLHDFTQDMKIYKWFCPISTNSTLKNYNSWIILLFIALVGSSQKWLYGFNGPVSYVTNVHKGFFHFSSKINFCTGLHDKRDEVEMGPMSNVHYHDTTYLLPNFIQI